MDKPINYYLVSFLLLSFNIGVLTFVNLPLWASLALYILVIVTIAADITTLYLYKTILSDPVKMLQRMGVVPSNKSRLPR